MARPSRPPRSALFSLIIAAAHVLVPIGLDVSYTVVDPRLRAGGATPR